MRPVTAALVAGCLALIAANSNGQTTAPSPPPLPSDGSPTASIVFPD